MREVVCWAALIVSLCAALFLCDWQRQRADDRVLAAHEALWNCLGEHNVRLAACRPGLARPLEDMDYCPEAVRACRATGLYQSTARAEEASSGWFRRRGIVLAATLSATIVLMLRVAAEQIMRWRRSKR